MVTKAEFERVKALMNKAMDELQNFHRATEKQYKIDYSKCDIDEIIDAIDYGQGGITYERFKELMEQAVKKHGTDDEYDIDNS